MAGGTTGTALLRLIAGRVRAARHARGLTIKEAAERSCLSTRFFADLEAGKGNIAIGRLALVAVALDVPLAELVADDAESRNRVIAFIGMRGAGKSTIAPLVSVATDRPFVEVDDMIEEEAGLAVSEIFALHGERYYRRLEARCVTSLLASHEPWVVTLSGGVVHNDGAWQSVQRRCTTVWLKATPEDHLQRVVEQGDMRPMKNRDRADAMNELRTLLATRKGLYSSADLAIETSGRTVEDVFRAAQTGLAEMGFDVSHRKEELQDYL